jgi:hypothetical protein
MASFDTGATWVAATEVDPPDGDLEVQWEVSVTDPTPVPGVRRVLLRAIDHYGHVSQGGRFVAYDEQFPVVVSTSFIGESDTFADGHQVRLLSEWNADDLEVTADFSEVDSEFEASSVTTFNRGDNLYEILYTISPNNSIEPGEKTIVVTAKTPYLVGTDSVTMILLDTHGENLVAIDRNRFDPDDGESVTISARSPTALVEVEIYNLAGRRVRTLKDEGFVEWDGLDDSRRRTASGVYFLRVLVESDEEMRKVAVTRGGGS